MVVRRARPFRHMYAYVVARTLVTDCSDYEVIYVKRRQTREWHAHAITG